MAKTEKWVLIGGVTLTWILLAYFAGGPVYSDEMLYIDVGLRNLTEVHYGNRYFHIYLQKLFMALAPTPLTGIRVFWGFLMALTAGLVYYNARTFTKRSSILNGLLAVAFFFSYSIIKEYSGEPAVDITAMAVVVVYLTIYLDLVNRDGNGKYHLFFLGALTFFGLKTKETTIFIHLLLIGLLLQEMKERGWLKSAIRYFAPYALGVLSAIVLFFLLDGLILGKPFFAISPSTFQGVFENYDFEPGFYFGPKSWYTEYLLDDILVPFMLFMLGGILLRKEVAQQKLLVWIYPLAYIGFLSWNMLKVPWGFIERFIYPALPIVAILAAQTIDFNIFRNVKKRWHVAVAVLVSMVVFITMRFVWTRIAQVYHFEFLRLMEAIYFPILISVMLAAIIWNDPPRWIVTLISLFCISVILFTPLSNNFKYFIRYPKIRERFAELFYPLEVFKDELQISSGERIYISTDFKKSKDMLSLDPNDISGMINFYYDERIDGNDVYIGYDRKKFASDLINRPFDYALLTELDHASLMNTPSWEKINDEYKQIFTDEKETVYLLKR